MPRSNGKRFANTRAIILACRELSKMSEKQINHFVFWARLLRLPCYIDIEFA